MKAIMRDNLVERYKSVMPKEYDAEIGAFLRWRPARISATSRRAWGIRVWRPRRFICIRNWDGSRVRLTGWGCSGLGG